MKQVKLLSVLMVLALVLIVAGCSSPPDAEQKAAKAAMDAAMSAGADKYASADFGAAKKTWDAAESQMKDKKYKEAKEGYIAAKAAFEKAAAGVEAGKKAVADQVNGDLANLEGAWKNLDATAKKMEKKMKDKDAWTNDAKAITEGLAKAKEMAASDPAGAKAKTDEVKGMMDKWDGAFKEMAAAPAPAPAKPEAPKKGKKS
jgi:PBP1b-binding outer membrane lipoprotein LpoB